jgi:hypothetical protein
MKIHPDYKTISVTRIIIGAIILSTLAVTNIYLYRALIEYKQILEFTTQERDAIQSKYLDEINKVKCIKPKISDLGPSDIELLPLVIKKLDLSIYNKGYTKDNFTFHLSTGKRVIGDWKKGTLIGDPKTENIQELRLGFIYPIEKFDEDKIKFDYNDQEYTWWTKVAQQCN